MVASLNMDFIRVEPTAFPKMHQTLVLNNHHYSCSSSLPLWMMGHVYVPNNRTTVHGRLYARDLHGGQ